MNRKQQRDRWEDYDLMCISFSKSSKVIHLHLWKSFATPRIFRGFIDTQNVPLVSFNCSKTSSKLVSKLLPINKKAGLSLSPKSNSIRFKPCRITISKLYFENISKSLIVFHILLHKIFPLMYNYLLYLLYIQIDQ